MGKIDKLKEIKTDIREIFKALIYLILGTLTGIATIIYKVLSGVIEPYMIILSFIGFVVVLLLLIYTVVIWNKMQKINEELENVD